MRIALLALGLTLVATAAFADDATPPPTTSVPPAEAPNPPPEPTTSVSLTVADRAAWASMAGAFEQCVGSLELQGNTAICGTVHNYLLGFSARVAASGK